MSPANPALWLRDDDRWLEPTRLAGETARVRRQARYNATAALIAAYRDEFDALFAAELAKGEQWLNRQIERARERAKARRTA